MHNYEAAMRKSWNQNNYYFGPGLEHFQSSNWNPARTRVRSLWSAREKPQELAKSFSPACFSRKFQAVGHSSNDSLNSFFAGSLLFFFCFFEEFSETLFSMQKFSLCFAFNLFLYTGQMPATIYRTLGTGKCRKGGVWERHQVEEWEKPEEEGLQWSRDSVP